MTSKQLMELARKIHREEQSGGAAMSDKKLTRWGRDPSDGWLYLEATGDWTPWQIADAEITRLRAENAELRKERDEARSNYQWMVDRACDQRLDGYRELGSRAAAAENSRDELRAHIAAHEKVCAGEWVKVAERDPGERGRYTVTVNESFRDGQSGTYVREMSFDRRWRHQQVHSTNPVVTVTHWWNARMPGGEE